MIASGGLELTPAAAAPSWQLRTFPEGSGARVESVPPSSFYVLGDFPDSREWVSLDGGFSGTIRNPGPPFTADSVTCFSAIQGRQGVVTLEGRLWIGTQDGREWSRVTVPDTLGVPSALLWLRADRLLVGTRNGSIARADLTAQPAAWSRTARLGESAVEKLLQSGDDRTMALLRDGGLFAQDPPSVSRAQGISGAEADSAWTEAPFAASLFDIARSGSGRAIARGSLDLYRTTDGGTTWHYISGALAAPALAHWAANARRLVIRPDGFGVIPCGDALLATTDGGGSWRVAAHGRRMFFDASIDDEGDLLTVGEGIHQSTDHANSMAQIMGADFTNVEVGSIATFWTMDRGLLLSVNQGERWLRQPIPDSVQRLSRIAASGDYRIWLHFDGEGGPRTFYSADRGAHYAEIDPAGNLRGLGDWSFPSENAGWAYADSVVLRSTDGGTGWIAVYTARREISSMAARDSLQAVFTTRDGFLLTRDGGRTWSEWTSAIARTTLSVALTDDDRLLAAGDGMVLIEAIPEGETLARIPFEDTLRSVVMLGREGWASGDGGILAGTTDGGASWGRYDVNLELNAFTGNLGPISAIGPDYAAAGAGSALLRLLPDVSGPNFRFGIAVNPFLEQYLDIHVTARERLRADSIAITIDGEPIPVELFDPGGFLYRARYRVPAGTADRLMITRGRDWLGNERTDARALWTSALSATAEAEASWRGERIRLWGGEAGIAVMIDLASEIPDFPDDPVWRPVGSPALLVGSGGISIAPASTRTALAVLVPVAGQGPLDPIDPDPPGIVGRWRILSSGTESAGAGSIVLLLRDSRVPAPGTRAEGGLSVFPIPARDAFWIRWDDLPDRAFRWSLHDLTGRTLARGAGAGSSTGPLRISTSDAAGHPLSSGAYWIRIESGSERAVRRLVVLR